VLKNITVWDLDVVGYREGPKGESDWTIPLGVHDLALEISSGAPLMYCGCDKQTEVHVKRAAAIGAHVILLKVDKVTRARNLKKRNRKGSHDVVQLTSEMTEAALSAQSRWEKLVSDLPDQNRAHIVDGVNSIWKLVEDNVECHVRTEPEVFSRDHPINDYLINLRARLPRKADDVE
jgi:hypothetical protein